MYTYVYVYLCICMYVLIYVSTQHKLTKHVLPGEKVDIYIYVCIYIYICIDVTQIDEKCSARRTR